MSQTSIFVIAEVGSVHDGSFGNANKLIELAAECGADAVKFQTHIAADETTRNAPMPPYFKGEPRFDYFERTGFSLNQWQALKKRSEECGIELISSPFSIAAVDLLEKVGVHRYKIASGEVTNLPMLENIARTGKQVLLSTGMSSWGEIDAAIEVIRRHTRDLVVMQCTSAYSCPDDRVGLNLIEAMAKRYAVPVGFSDHTLDNVAAFAAAACGASTIEKHLTFSRKMYGSDAANAAEPTQFKELIKGLRAIAVMRANPVDKDDLRPFSEMKRIFEKSIVSAVQIPKGAILTADMLAVKKPGDGIAPARMSEIIGRRTARMIPADQLLSLDDLASF